MNESHNIHHLTVKSSNAMLSQQTRLMYPTTQHNTTHLHNSATHSQLAPLPKRSQTHSANTDTARNTALCQTQRYAITNRKALPLAVFTEQPFNFVTFLPVILSQDGDVSG
jgi:hypothetical protein